MMADRLGTHSLALPPRGYVFQKARHFQDLISYSSYKLRVLRSASKFWEEVATFSLFSARRDAGRVERPQNSGRKWLPSRCLRRVGMLTRGASSKFWAQAATLSLFLMRRDAGAWSVFEIQVLSGRPLVVFGAS